MDEENSDIKQLEYIFNNTTATKIEDSKGNLIFGTHEISSFDNHPQQLQFRNPKELDSLKPEWEIVWKSFGAAWSPERQLFRYLHSEIRAYMESYRFYRDSFAKFLSLVFNEDAESKIKMDIYALDCEVAVKSVYEYGKHSIDLIQKIENVMFGEVKTVEFCEKFSETRNKFLTHYHNPHNIKDIIFDPIYFSVAGTGNLFEVRIHLPNKERAYSAFLNHRLDYFTLEEILFSKLKLFAETKVTLVR